MKAFLQSVLNKNTQMIPPNPIYMVGWPTMTDGEDNTNPLNDLDLEIYTSLKDAKDEANRSSQETVVMKVTLTPVFVSRKLTVEEEL